MPTLRDQLQEALGDTFVIDREMEAGGMSRLFLALESSLNRRVVVKVLPPDWVSEMSVTRFRREMEVAARLQHPHILPVLTAGARTGLLYFVMPYVAGESLRHRLKRDGALPIGDAQRILAEVADALSFAHERGVIHRDIKPENILLEGNHAVLSDFGVARALAESRTDGGVTSAGVSVGTPGYMAPEQIAGEPVDPSTDIYALAIVGYEMIAGRAPFTGDSPHAVMMAHISTPPPSIRELKPDAPAHVSAALSRALSKEPGARFANATEFAQAILGPVSKTNGAPGGGMLRGPKRVAAAIALGVGALVWALYAFTQARTERATLVQLLIAEADSGRIDEVHRSLDSVGLTLSSTGLGPLAAKVGGTVAVQTDPPGAEVTMRRVKPIATLAERAEIPIGRTPVGKHLLVAGEYLLRITPVVGEPMELVVDVQPGKDRSVARQIPVADSTFAGMSFVPDGHSPDGHPVSAFYIDRHEVTNAEYQRFVSTGGYRETRHWPDSIIAGGRWLRRSEALKGLLDRTGLPAPRYWRDARFPEGKPDEPVVGVTWYEAAAYASWVGAVLPDRNQWFRAALDQSHNVFPWGNDGATVEQRANFGQVGTMRVGSFPAGVSPFGCYDMAGNVREWILDAAKAGKRTVVGGSWQDPSYMIEPAHAEHFDPLYANEAFGFRLVRAAPPRK